MGLTLIWMAASIKFKFVLDYFICPCYNTVVFIIAFIFKLTQRFDIGFKAMKSWAKTRVATGISKLVKKIFYLRASSITAGGYIQRGLSAILNVNKHETGLKLLAQLQKRNVWTAAKFITLTKASLGPHGPDRIYFL